MYKKVYKMVYKIVYKITPEVSQFPSDAMQQLKNLSVTSEIAQETEELTFLYGLVSSWVENGTKPETALQSLQERGAS